MAVVDSFEFLLVEIEKTFSNARDILAILGILYGCKKSLQILNSLLEAANGHLLSKLSYIGDYRKRFGLWAGNFLTFFFIFKFLYSTLRVGPGCGLIIEQYMG
jgi:hypothetical protein